MWRADGGDPMMKAHDNHNALAGDHGDVDHDGANCVTCSSMPILNTQAHAENLRQSKKFSEFPLRPCELSLGQIPRVFRDLLELLLQ